MVGGSSVVSPNLANVGEVGLGTLGRIRECQCNMLQPGRCSHTGELATGLLIDRSILYGFAGPCSEPGKPEVATRTSQLALDLGLLSGGLRRYVAKHERDSSLEFLHGGPCARFAGYAGPRSHCPRSTSLLLADQRVWKDTHACKPRIR